MTTIDRYADFKQVQNSDYFRVGTLGKKSIYYKLQDSDFQFQELSDLSLMNPYVFPDFLVEKGKLKILFNDKAVSNISLGVRFQSSEKETDENVQIHQLNSGNFLILEKREKGEVKLLFLPGLNSQTIVIPIEGAVDVSFTASDSTGSTFLFIDKNGLIQRLDLINKNLKKTVVGSYKENIDDIKYSAKAEALIIVDRKKWSMSVIDAKSGALRGVLPLKKGEQINLLNGTQGALINNKLVDLVTAQVADQLEGFCPKSEYVIDFTNKKLYYSSCEAGKEDSPKANPTYLSGYDLHEMKLESQVNLGEKSVSETEKLTRTDEVKSLFLDNLGRLIVLTVPI